MGVALNLEASLIIKLISILNKIYQEFVVRVLDVRQNIEQMDCGGVPDFAAKLN